MDGDRIGSVVYDGLRLTDVYSSQLPPPIALSLPVQVDKMFDTYANSPNALVKLLWVRTRTLQPTYRRASLCHSIDHIALASGHFQSKGMHVWREFDSDVDQYHSLLLEDLSFWGGGAEKWTRGFKTGMFALIRSAPPSELARFCSIEFVQLLSLHKPVPKRWADWPAPRSEAV